MQQWGNEATAAGMTFASSAMKLAVARVGKGPKDDAGVLVHGLTKVHGEGENEDQEEQVDAKQRMQ